MQSILMIGLGKIGLEVAKQLASQGHQVIGISRSQPKDLSQPMANLHFVASDARNLTVQQLQAWSSQITQVCIIVSPSVMSEQGYRDSYYAIAENLVKLSDDLPKLSRVVFISSTGVYGQNAGEIIDNTTPVQTPTSATSKVILDTEKLLQQHFAEDCVIIRPSGIYGHTRLRLISMATQLAQAQATNSTTELPSNIWSNRIFDTDLIAIIVNVINAAQTVPVYLATDNTPVPLFTVLNYLATAQGLTLSLPDTAPSTGKRIVNNLPKDWLTYPNWQLGYQAILQSLHD